VFAILCDSEQVVLSSKTEDKAWTAVEALAQQLNSSLSEAGLRVMFGWKGKSHMADAKETYAWRRTIDSIKESDLSAQASMWTGASEDVRLLIKSRPIMLRMAGEITNALMHSYQNRHKISFSQIESVEPSGRAT
jgi:hypothetical protein